MGLRTNRLNRNDDDSRRLRFCKHIAAALLCCGCMGARAAIHIDVTTTADEFGSGTGCSFREALYAVAHATAFGGCALGNSLFGNSITLPAGIYTINRAINGNAESGGAFYVSVPVFIGGAGAGKTILDGGSLDRVMDIEPAAIGASVSVYSLSIRNGLPPLNGFRSGYGAGVYAGFSGSLSLYQVVISDSGDESPLASALFVTWAAANLASTTIMRNHATGVFLFATAASEFDNVTISGNLSYSLNGGLELTSTNGVLTLNNTTIAYNTGDAMNQFPGKNAGGLYVDSSTVNVRNSIIARNSIGTREAGADCHGAITSQGYNLIEDTGNCNIGGSTLGNLSGVDPLLAPLFDYGAAIPTHLLLPNSPALDAGNPTAAGSGGSACLSGDARGSARGVTRCDIGAYEYRADFVVNSTADAGDTNPGDGVCASTLPSGACTLRAASEEAGADSAFRTIRVPAGHYVLTDPAQGLGFSSTHAITVLGDGADRSVIEQTQNGVVASVQQAAVSLHGLRLSGAPGAVIAGSAALLLDAVHVSGNSVLPAILLSECCASDLLIVNSTVDHNVANVSFGGGGLYVGAGSSATILNSTFFHNSTTHDGGAIYNHGGTVSMAFTTIAGNSALASTAGDIGGGGIARGGSGSFFIRNSIIAGNFDASGQAADCAGIIQVTGWTLLRDGSGCTVGGIAAELLGGIDPLLSSLALQFGHVPTLGLAAGSLAHGVITDPKDCIDGSGIQTLTDQRGMARPRAGYGTSGASICDLGAFQGVSDVIFADGLG